GPRRRRRAQARYLAHDRAQGDPRARVGPRRRREARPALQGLELAPRPRRALGARGADLARRGPGVGVDLPRSPHARVHVHRERPRAPARRRKSGRSGGVAKELSYLPSVRTSTLARANTETPCASEIERAFLSPFFQLFVTSTVVV